MGIFALLSIGLVVLAIVLVRRQRAIKKKKQKKTIVKKQPRKMESANIYATKFNYGGALVLDAKLRGPVKHACDDEHTTSLHTIQFDNNLNEIVDIGSQIEIVNERASTVTTEQDDDKKPSKHMSVMQSLKQSLMIRKKADGKSVRPVKGAQKSPEKQALLKPSPVAAAPLASKRGNVRPTPGSANQKKK